MRRRRPQRPGQRGGFGRGGLPPLASHRLALLPPPDDQLVGLLLRLARAQAQGRLAPRRLGVAAGAGLALAAAVRVVNRVHGRAADLGPLAQPARAAGLAARLVLVLQVADLAQGGLAAHVDAAQLGRGHAHDGVAALLGQELRRGARRADQLAATAQRQLDVVDRRADGDPLQRQRVADADRGVGAAHDRVPDLQAQRRQDVALLAVPVVDQRDPRGAVGVVLDRGDLARHAVLVAPEVDLAVRAAAVATAVAHRHLALVVAAGMARELLQEALLRLGGRDLLEARRGHEAATGAGRLVLPDWHIRDSRTGLPAPGRTAGGRWPSSSRRWGRSRRVGRGAAP